MWSNTKFIYIITCSANDKKYVGRTRLPERRKKMHFDSLKAGKHRNKMMQNDFNEFGEKAFAFEVIGKDTRENGRSDEFKWMECLKTYDPAHGYNDRDPAMNPVRRENGLPYRTQPKYRRVSTELLK